MENRHIHVFKDTVVPPTCKENGYTLHKCDCGYEHRDNFTPVAQHSFVVVEQTAPTCASGGIRKLRCTSCGEEIVENLPPLSHDWGNWLIQTFPTCTESGLQLRICGRCGCTEEQEIPPKGHKLVNPQKSKTEKKTIEYFCENCGQIIKQPSGSRKFRKFLSRHKKGLIASTISLVLVVALVLSTIFLFIPGFHYYRALSLIEDGAYTAAYSHLDTCRGFKDTDILLNDFEVHYQKVKTTTYTKTGKVEDTSTDRNEYLYKYDDNHKLEYLIKEDAWRYEFTYDDNGRKISEVAYDSENRVDTRYDYKYNKDGKLIYELRDYGSYKYEYNLDGKGNLISALDYEEGEVVERTEYKRNSKGLEISRITYDANDNIISKLENKFDGDDLVSGVEYDENGKVVKKYSYECDSEGVISRICYDKDGDIEYEYHYYSNGNIERYVFCEDGKISEEVEFYENGKRKLGVLYDEKGKIMNKYEYDDRGNVTLNQWYNEEDDEMNITTYEYEYHNDGSYIEKQYDEDGNLTAKTEYSDPVIIYDPYVRWD